MTLQPKWIDKSWETPQKLTTVSGEGNFLVVSPGKRTEGFDFNGTGEMKHISDISMNPNDPYSGWTLSNGGLVSGYSDNNKRQCFQYSITWGGTVYKPGIKDCEWSDNKSQPTIFTGDTVQPLFWQLGITDLKKHGGMTYDYSKGMHVSHGNICYNKDTGLYWNIASGGQAQTYIPNECSWLTLEDAAACCSLPESGRQFDQCKSSYNPSSTNSSCPDVMLNYCTNKWIQQCSGKTSTSLDNILTSKVSDKCSNDGSPCAMYLSDFKNSPSGQKTIKKAIINFIDNNAEKSSIRKNGQPVPDYISSRDKTNNFFTSVIPNLCSTVPGACDDVLSYYCASHTRDELNKDDTLRKMCGCYLQAGGENQQKPLEMKYKMTNPPQTKAQYPFPDLKVPCDPLCNFRNVVQKDQNINGNWQPDKCQSTVCIMDNININIINSKTGGIYLKQECSDGQCFIDRNVVNQIKNAEEKHNVKISDNCKKCFLFDPSNPGDPQCVNCKTFLPCSINGPSGGGGTWNKIKQYFSKHKKELVVAGIILLILLFIIIYIMMHKHYSTKYPGVSGNQGPTLQDYWNVNTY